MIEKIIQRNYFHPFYNKPAAKQKRQPFFNKTGKVKNELSAEEKKHIKDLLHGITSLPQMEGN